MPPLLPAGSAVLVRLGRLTRPARRSVLRRRRPLAALLVAVAVAAGLHAAAPPAPVRIGVLVAARDLPSGVVLAADDLTRAAYAPGTVPDGATGEAAVGRTLAGPLRRGEPVTDVRLVGPALVRGRPGLAAVPVRLPDAAMVALLRVGDRIDLVAADPQGSPARVVAHGVPVLALPTVEEASGVAGPLPGRLVVVGVPSADVTEVADAAARYFLMLTLSG